MGSYYLTLISGSNREKYDNTSSKFINQLPMPLDLDSNTEFGLCEISYIPNINNIDNIQKSFSIFDFEHLHTEGPYKNKLGNPHWFDIEAGYFRDEIIFCQYLNELIWNSIPRLKNKKIIQYSAIKRKFKVEAKIHEITIEFAPPITHILGMTNVNDHGHITIGKGHKLGDTILYKGESMELVATKSWEALSDGYQPHVSGLYTSETLFIYSDLVFQQYSGNSFTNLLRMCTIHDQNNKRIVQNFEKIHYKPVNKNLATTIEIHIKNIEDKFISLKGLTYIKLHFRKKKNPR